MLEFGVPLTDAADKEDEEDKDEDAADNEDEEDKDEDTSDEEDGDAGDEESNNEEDNHEGTNSNNASGLRMGMEMATPVTRTETMVVP